MNKTHINIHHTAMYSEDLSEQFDAVNEGHRKRWNGKTKSSLGFYGGYHYLIERNGAVQQFREEKEVGAHNNVKMMNYRAIGVCFAGNMSRQNLTDAQVKVGVELISDIQKRYNIPDENIRPHRFYKATQCPGTKLADPVWDTLKEKADALSPKKEKWRAEIEEWAGQYLRAPDAFFKGEVDLHKIVALIRRVKSGSKIKKNEK